MLYNSEARPMSARNVCWSSPVLATALGVSAASLVNADTVLAALPTNEGSKSAPVEEHLLNTACALQNLLQRVCPNGTADLDLKAPGPLAQWYSFSNWNSWASWGNYWSNMY